MTKWIIIFYLLLPLSAKASSDLHCKAYMLMRETNGTKSIKMQRAVLNVLHNRMRKFNMSACKVIHMNGQFPYMVNGLKPVSNYWLTHAEKLSRMTPLLDRDYLYFNTVKHKWGKEQLKVGTMWFSK